jgi:molecular chaperone DnaJ
MTDLYAILGVTRDADPETIKAAYRAKAKRLHPDQGGGADEFAELQRAYETAERSAKARPLR